MASNSGESVKLILALLAPVGLGLFRAGQSLEKNFVSSLMKPLIHFAIGILSFWALGSGFSGVGGSDFIGYKNFLFVYGSNQTMFFDAIGGFYCCAIASAGGQDFMHLKFEALLAFALMSFIYPVPLHWLWKPEGWLRHPDATTRDEAGAGVIHLVGGSFALGLVLLCKPRSGRFLDLGLKNTRWSRKASTMGLSAVTDMSQAQTSLKSGSNVASAGLGTFLSVIGALNFIHFTKNEESDDLLFSCFVSMSSASLVAMLTSRYLTKQWSLYRLRGGALIGLVGVSSCANQIYHWAAFVIGCISGLTYIGGRNILFRFKLDDPTDAVSIHALGGFVSLCLSPFFSKHYGIIYTADSSTFLPYLGWNLVTILMLILWSLTFCLLIFGPLAFFDKLGTLDSCEASGSNMEMREVVQNQANKGGGPNAGGVGDCCKKCSCKYLRQEKSLRTPRVVVSERLDSKPFSTMPRPLPEYRMAETMPAAALSQQLADGCGAGQKFMTIDQRKRSRSYGNLIVGQQVQPPESDDVFHEQVLIASEVVPIRTTPGRKLGVANSKSGVQKKTESPLSFKNNIPRAPIFRFDDNNNSSGSELDLTSAKAKPPPITRKAVYDQVLSLKQHDGPQRESWSHRRSLTPLNSTSTEI